jgi:hypothetical protein
MKTGALLPLLLLAACDGSTPDPQRAESGNGSEAAARAPAEPDDGKIECALAGAAEFRRECSLERKDGVDGRVLTVIGPRGGFRRLLVTRDGRGVTAYDGAEPARITILSPDRIEVAIGGDRYRLPATIRS